MEHLSDATRFQTIEGCREYLGKILARAANRPGSVPASFIAGMKNLGPHEMNEFKEMCRWYVHSPINNLVTREYDEFPYAAGANLVDKTFAIYTTTFRRESTHHKAIVAGDEVVILGPGTPSLSLGHYYLTKFGRFVLTLIDQPAPHPYLPTLCREMWAKELSPHDKAAKGLKLRELADQRLMPDAVLQSWRRDGLI